MIYIFNENWRHSWDICTLLQNNSEFLGCLGVSFWDLWSCWNTLLNPPYCWFTALKKPCFSYSCSCYSSTVVVIFFKKKKSLDLSDSSLVDDKTFDDHINTIVPIVNSVPDEEVSSPQDCIDKLKKDLDMKNEQIKSILLENEVLSKKIAEL